MGLSYRRKNKSRRNTQNKRSIKQFCKSRVIQENFIFYGLIVEDSSQQVTLDFVISEDQVKTLEAIISNYLHQQTICKRHDLGVLPKEILYEKMGSDAFEAITPFLNRNRTRWNRKLFVRSLLSHEELPKYIVEMLLLKLSSSDEIVSTILTTGKSDTEIIEDLFGNVPPGLEGIESQFVHFVKVLVDQANRIQLAFEFEYTHIRYLGNGQNTDATNTHSIDSIRNRNPVQYVFNSGIDCIAGLRSGELLDEHEIIFRLVIYPYDRDDQERVTVLGKTIKGDEISSMPTSYSTVTFAVRLNSSGELKESVFLDRDRERQPNSN